MTQRAYEVFEHTADIGLHAFGRTLPELFIHAAQGMESLMVAPLTLPVCHTASSQMD